MGDIQKSDINSLKDTIINCLRSQINCCKDIKNFKIKCCDDISSCLEKQIVLYKDMLKFDSKLSEFDSKLSEIDSKLSEFDDKRLFRELLLHYKYKELSKKRDNNKVWYLFLYLFLFLCIVYCTIIIIINLF